jgi:hypothetical protein
VSAIPLKLNTLTAAQGVAQALLAREPVLTGGTADLIAADAIYALGFDIHPSSSEWRDVGLLRDLRAACERYVRDEAELRRRRDPQR